MAETLHLRDPREMRALAHPARLAIIDALASGDEADARVKIEELLQAVQRFARTT